MKVVINMDLCEGNARCQEAAPQVFEVGDDDRAHLLVAEPDESQRAAVERAVRLCPRQAITIVEDK
ncbi:MAG TPA: ferredoxin [Dehalococcoidia bacterium]